MTFATTPFGTSAFSEDGSPKTRLEGQATVSASARLIAGASSTLAGSAYMVAGESSIKRVSGHLRASASLEAAGGRIFYTSSSLSVSATIQASTDTPIYAATTDYTSRPNDVPANTPFPGRVETPLEFERSIVQGGNIGGAVTGFGLMDLKASDGAYDYLIGNWSIEGRRVVVKLGDADGSYGAFGTIFDGTARGWFIDDDTLSVQLRDRSYLLERPLLSRTYAGTGGAEGISSLAGSRVPRAYGEALNVTPVMIDTINLIFQFNDGQSQAVDNVYVRGFALTDSATDYADYASLAAASVSAGEYATCLAEGLFKIAYLLEGEVTADIKGNKYGGTYVNTTSTIVERIVKESGGLIDADISASSFSALETAQPAVIGIYFGADESPTISDVVGLLMNGIGGDAGFTRSGTYQVGRFELPTTDEADALLSFEDTEIINIRRLAALDAYSPPPFRWRVAYARNWTIQTSDLAGSVQADPDRQAFLSEPYSVASSTDTAGSLIVQTNHPLAQDPGVIEAYFRDEADAEDEADRRFDMWKRERSMYEIELKTQPFLLDLRNQVHITYPRWDLTSGKNARIVTITENAKDNIVVIVGVTR